MHSEITTDLSIVHENLSKRKANKENVVLIKTGALNPIHRSHIANMIKVKQYLEEVYDLNVVAGYISPTHDQYVQGKLGKHLIPSQHRIQMCQRAIQEENQQHWLAVDQAEALGRTLHSHISSFLCFVFSSFVYFSKKCDIQSSTVSQRENSIG